MSINYYLLLGVSTDADHQRIRLAYRSLAKRFHPDANNGCEASADLFKQINDAYRTLTDPKLRTSYDAEQASIYSKQTQQTPKVDAIDPQQKFDHFLYSLLDAIFAPVGRAPPPPKTSSRAPPNQHKKTVRKKPDFRFFYYLAMEQDKTSYERSEDGIIRQTPKQKAREPTLNTRFRQTSSRVLTILLTCLWSLFNP